MKELLIITSYFPPETGAASNRIFQLAEGLVQQQIKVSVITPLPNYPTGQIFEAYRNTFRYTSVENGINIHRLWIFASNSKNKFLRLLAMLSYSFSLIWFFLWIKIPQTVVVQSPPLLVAFTCMCFLKSQNRKLILNVSDLWPIAGLELGSFKNDFSYRVLENIERFNYRKADLVTGQSEEILQHVTTLFPVKETFLYRNYPNFEAPLVPIQKHLDQGKIKIVYAGLLGVAQGVLKLCESLVYQGYELHIYGSGSEKKKIQAFISAHPELPITYHGEVSRQELHEVLLQYDLTIIPLLNRIYGSVPSKIFEYALLGLPMVYFGGGEGENLIKKYQLGWFASPGDYKALNYRLSNIKRTDLHSGFRVQIRQTAIENFDFEKQLEAFIKFL